MAEFRKEVQLMQRLHHPNIVQFFGACMETPLMLVCEFMPGGTLTTYRTRRQGKAIKFEVCLRFAQHIAAGLSYLHSHQIIHRDLKPSNLLLDDKLNLKVSLPRKSNKQKPSSCHATWTQEPSYVTPNMLRMIPCFRWQTLVWLPCARRMRTWAHTR